MRVLFSREGIEGTLHDTYTNVKATDLVQSWIACVASVSVGFRSRERPRIAVFDVLAARKVGREQKLRKRCSLPPPFSHSCTLVPLFTCLKHRESLFLIFKNLQATNLVQT